MKIKLFILILFAAVFLSSCCTQRPIEKMVETKTEIKEVVRDTTIYVPADQATVKALLECDSLGNVLIKEIKTLQGKQNAKANIRIANNEITADCFCDSLSIYLQLKDRYETVNITETKTQYLEKSFNWWQITLLISGILFWVFIIITVGYNLKKR